MGNAGQSAIRFSEKKKPKGINHEVHCDARQRCQFRGDVFDPVQRKLFCPLRFVEIAMVNNEALFRLGSDASWLRGAHG